MPIPRDQLVLFYQHNNSRCFSTMPHMWPFVFLYCKLCWSTWRLYCASQASLLQCAWQFFSYIKYFTLAPRKRISNIPYIPNIKDKCFEAIAISKLVLCSFTVNGKEIDAWVLNTSLKCKEAERWWRIAESVSSVCNRRDAFVMLFWSHLHALACVWVCVCKQ